MRNILWEARQAAEFAASARAAAASQRAADARIMCSSRSELKATVREHKRDLLQVTALTECWLGGVWYCTLENNVPGTRFMRPVSDRVTSHNLHGIGIEHMLYCAGPGCVSQRLLRPVVCRLFRGALHSHRMISA